MKLNSDNFLSRFYNVIDKSNNQRLEEVQYINDIRGIYHTTKFEHRHKNVGIRMNSMDYVIFIKQGSVELTGKNKFFKLLKKVSDIIIK